ncbi:MAG TPA: hypothetical protein VFH47_08865 [Candidatus Thermoplasmatota archaeon]|nr:hypothetical protein [Candidatus Thermoplasmatota archaeon]
MHDPRWWEAACRVFPLAAAASAKGKLVPPAAAEAHLAMPELDAVEQACSALQTWCWVRGLPPLDRLVAHARARDPVRPVADYEAFYEALGWDVTTERAVLGYPWRKVMEPTPEDVGRAVRLAQGCAAPLREWRRLDLELDLREADAARGRRRPAPTGTASWDDARALHARLLGPLQAAGAALATLRPPGAAPYPPPRPRESPYEHL